MRKDNRVAVAQRTLFHITIPSTARKPVVKTGHHFDSPVTDVLSVWVVQKQREKCIKEDLH